MRTTVAVTVETAEVAEMAAGENTGGWGGGDSGGSSGGDPAGGGATNCDTSMGPGICVTSPGSGDTGSGGGDIGGGGADPGVDQSGPDLGGPTLSWDGYGLGGPIPQPARPPISTNCKKALKTAGKKPSVLDAATAQWGMLLAAANYQGVDVSILASMAIRESGFQSIPQQGGSGNGHGEFQLDENTWGSPIPSWAYDPQYAAVAAAGQLAGGMGNGIAWFQKHGYGPWGQLAGGLRPYNHGLAGANRVRAVDQTGVPQFADRGTAGPNGGNYVSNVIAIAVECFGFPQ